MKEISLLAYLKNKTNGYTGSTLNVCTEIIFLPNCMDSQEKVPGIRNAAYSSETKPMVKFAAH